MSPEHDDPHFVIEREGKTNNMLSVPMRSDVATLITEQGEDWGDYDLSFTNNAYQITDAGPVLLGFGTYARIMPEGK